MTAGGEQLPPTYGTVVAGPGAAPVFALGGKLACNGLTTLAGNAKSGRTSLAVEMVRGYLADNESHRVLVITTRQQDVQWRAILGAVDQVTIVAVDGAVPADAMIEYGHFAERLKAALIVVDSMNDVAGAAAPDSEMISSVLSLPAAVLAIFDGYATSAGIGTHLEAWRSSATACLWLREIKKSSDLAGQRWLRVESRWAPANDSPVNVPYIGAPVAVSDPGAPPF